MNYWKECISIAADDIGLVLTDEQLDYLADSVEGGYENYGMALGHDAIPNTREAEVEKLKAEIRKLEENHDRQLWGIKKEVAQRRNVTPHDVHVEDDGHVTYDRM